MPSAAWRHKSSRAWERVRTAVLQANLLEHGGRCRLAVPGVCTGDAREVHHVLGRGVTGDDPRYLMAVCRACNLHVGDPMAGQVAHRPVTRW